MIAVLLLMLFTGAAFALHPERLAGHSLFVIAVLTLAYQHCRCGCSRSPSRCCSGPTRWSAIPPVCEGVLWLPWRHFGCSTLPLRRALLSGPFLAAYRKLLPSMSATSARRWPPGAWWDGELFTGPSRLAQLLGTRPAQLSAEEQAFLDGPCEIPLAMVDDFEVRAHRRGDVPPEAWDYIKQQGFFALDHPQRRIGGLQFGTYAQSSVLIKLASHSITLASTVVQLARPRRAAGALRHRSTEEPLPAAPGARR
jgi:hypothetical protein